MRATTPDQALATPTEITELHVSDAWDRPWQSLVGSLPGLQTLHLEEAVDADPSSVATWPAGLRSLVLGGGHRDAVAAWARAGVPLASLELRDDGDEPFEIPEAVAAIPGLSRLAVRAKAAVLPEALAGGSVTELALALAPGEVPEGLCRLTQLRRLRLAQRVRSLPAAFAQLTSLEILDLAGSLNGGTMSADTLPASEHRPLPAVLAELPALRTLVLDRCGIFEGDLERLAGHPRLHRLSLGFAGVADLSPLRALPALRELDLRACGRVRDLSPLAGLPLTWVGLDDCDRLRDLSPLLELHQLRGLSMKGCDAALRGPVLTHPTLEDLEADDETMGQWARRAELAGRTADDIRKGLSATEPARRRQALSDLARWVELTSAPDNNALGHLFGLSDEDREGEPPMALPELSRALEDPGVDGALAVRVFAACFRSDEDNFAPALEAADLVIERGTQADQRALVDAFGYARRFYDAGHRSFEEDVHERLIAEVLPRLGLPALLHLLGQLSVDDLHADQLEELFVVAYGQASSPEQLDALDGRLRAYAASLCRRPTELVAAIVERQPAAQERLADLLGPTPEERWDARLVEAAGPEQLQAELSALLSALDAGELPVESLGGSLSSRIRDKLGEAGELSPELARRVAERALRSDQSAWLRPEVLGPLVRDEWDWLRSQSEADRERIAGALRDWQRREFAPEGIDLTAARARLTGVPEEELRGQALQDSLEHALKWDARELTRALVHFIARPVPFEITSQRSRYLAKLLDKLRIEKDPDATVRLMDALLAARPHLTWSPEDQQYPLTYLLPIALERGPQFFAEHVAPWLEGQELVDPRFAYNLACYQATHGDTEALCGAIRRALRLGKPVQQFREDADFAGRLKEPEVRALLEEWEELPRYYAMSRADYYDAPCRFLDMGYKPDRPAWWELRWRRGQPFDELPEGPLRFDLEPFNEHAEEMSRALPLVSLFKIPLMHRSLVEVLEAHGAKLQKVPAVLVDPDDGAEHGDYFAVNVLGVIDPKALGRFHGRITDNAHIDGVGFSALTGHHEPLDGLVLAWLHDTSTLVVFEPLRDALVEAGFDELRFDDLRHIAM
ncbi:MAG: hypothetical protein D6776_06870 [Planctomycetota bacterium]|nr:MAG: hypothetical protein D6776_06870 [Planctomycetota bacterium]